MSKIFYTINDAPRKYCFSHASCYDLEERDDLDEIAESCAQDFHESHDGYERTWPIIVSLFAAESDEEAIHRVEVGIEYEPVFTALG